MKFGKFLKDKINFILGFILCCFVVAGYMNAMQIDKMAIFFVVIILCLFFTVGFLVNYFVKNRYLRNLDIMLDGLDEKYLLSEVMDKPRREENLAYYKILKKVNKSMLENVANARMMSKEYKEYIESWVHEIKIPITSAKLLCENNRLEVTNKKWLEFILNQIMINAIKYKRDTDSCVTIEACVIDDIVRLSIIDNGVGIKKSEIDRIFDKGFTGTNGRNQKRSTGIGLFLCKKLCKELNIGIFAESVEGKYTKICLEIPRS